VQTKVKINEGSRELGGGERQSIGSRRKEVDRGGLKTFWSGRSGKGDGDGEVQKGKCLGDRDGGGGWGDSNEIGGKTDCGLSVKRKGLGRCR